MIAQISGKLIGLEDDCGLVDIGGICYEVMLPGYAISGLSVKVGKDVTLCTMEYFEGTPGKGNLIPRMVGFLTPSEREFFRCYTSVKGMGIKKGLKSLTIPIPRIAAAIESGDEKMLISLPSVGKRLAQLMIAELKGKLENFAAGETYIADGETPGGAAFDTFQTEALEILVAWGEKRNEAMELIDMACKRHPEIETAENLVPLVYRIKQGIEV